MSGARGWLWTIPFAMALPAPAAAQGVDLCAPFQRLIAASHEASPFASIREALARGENIVPGFNSATCRVRDGSVACSARGMSIFAFDGWPDPVVCPGLSAVLPPPSERPRRRTGDWGRVYRGGGLLFEYGVSCALCAGPASGGITIRFDRPETRVQ